MRCILQDSIPKALSRMELEALPVFLVLAGQGKVDRKRLSEGQEVVQECGKMNLHMLETFLWQTLLVEELVREEMWGEIASSESESAHPNADGRSACKRYWGFSDSSDAGSVGDRCGVPDRCDLIEQEADEMQFSMQHEARELQKKETQEECARLKEDRLRRDREKIAQIKQMSNCDLQTLTARAKDKAG